MARVPRAAPAVGVLRPQLLPAPQRVGERVVAHAGVRADVLAGVRGVGVAVGGGGVALPSGGELHRGALRSECGSALLPVAVVSRALHLFPDRLRRCGAVHIRQRASSQRIQCWEHP